MPADLLTWAFRSPRRLALIAILLIGVVMAGVNVLSQGADDAASRAVGGTPGVTASTTTPAGRVPDSGSAVAAAVAFVDVWGHPDPKEPPATWSARLAPLTTADLAAALGSTDPAALPGSRAQGQPVVRYLAQDSALIAVPLAGGDRVVVTVVSQGGRWVASDVQPDVGDGESP